MRNVKKQKYAITLTELLIVVVILAVLCGLAIPIYKNAIENIKDKEAISVLKAIAVAENVYFSRYDEYFPPAEVAGDAGAIFATNLNRINSALGTHISLSENWKFCIVHRWFYLARFCDVYAKSLKGNLRYFKVSQTDGGVPGEPDDSPSWPSGCEGLGGG